MRIKIIIAPIIVGGKDVPSLVDGESIKDESELNKLLPLVKAQEILKQLIMI